MTQNAKIILVDDNAFFRESLRFLIEIEGMGEVVAEAENGQVFLNLLEIFNPDLVILDINMPVIGGLEATLKAIAKRPDLKILVLTMTFGKENCDAMKNAGVKGYILKTEGKQVLERAIRTMIEGKSYFPGHHL